MKRPPPLRHLDRHATLEPDRARFVEVRGTDGRLYGRFDPQRLLLEVKKGRQVEVIDLKALRP